MSKGQESCKLNGVKIELIVHSILAFEVVPDYSRTILSPKVVTNRTTVHSPASHTLSTEGTLTHCYVLNTVLYTQTAIY